MNKNESGSSENLDPASWKGSRLLQLREFRAFPLKRKLEILEQMSHVTARLLAAREKEFGPIRFESF